MNRKIPYEHTLAEKMEELSVPNMEASWQKMKSILDAEMPQTDKKRPAAAKWWISTLAVLLITGTAFYYLLSPSGSAEPAPGHASESSSLSVQPSSPVALERGARGAVKTDTENARLPLTDDTQVTDEKREPEYAATHSGDSIRLATTETSEKQLLLPSLTSVQRSSAEHPSYQQKQIAEKTTEGVQHNDNQRNQGQLPDIHTAAGSLHEAATTAVQDVAARHTSNNPGQHPSSGSSILHPLASLPGKNIRYSDVSAFNSPRSLPSRNKYLLPENEDARKAAIRQLKRQQRRDERDMARSYRTSRSLWGEQPERWFAAGIAPFQNISIGDQKNYSYGAGANRNIATDYIPAPYLQLHLTNRVYVQSEFQFNAPQSTPVLLLDQRSLITPATTAMQEQTFLRKLYYFHMPVSFYYSPVPNFYIGSGLQFSSLSSGLATVEQTAADNTPLRSETITLKEDAMTSKLRGSEWRYLVDASYYINRFSFGVRYSQALSNYIDQKAVNNLPDIQARNQAIQLYMRYNIIVSDKRR